jgi:hypothetical protein
MTGTTRTIGWLALGLLALVQSGCMLALAGAAGAGAAAGYVYYRGLVYRDYPANLGDAVAAVRTSLLELQFPILVEKTDTGSGYFESRTADNNTVRIYLDMVASPIPAEGSLTRVAIRVGFSGDDVVSTRILDQVSRHLVAAVPSRQLASPPGPPPVPATPIPSANPSAAPTPAAPLTNGATTSARSPAPAVSTGGTANSLGEPRPSETTAPPLATSQPRLQPVPAGGRQP